LNNHELFTSVYIINKDILMSLVDQCIAHNEDHFFVHGIKERLADLKVQTYENKEYGVFVNSIESYYRHNMNLLNEENYRALFYKQPFIRTKIGNQPPTKYRSGATVTKSILGNGCQIDGDVEGSILFRGVSVEAGATIKNSIIMQRCKIEAGVYLENVILDKDVHITANQKLIGSKEKPYVIAKSKTF
jgi:glucose-1-phosphate adenylyltransferase